MRYKLQLASVLLGAAVLVGCEKSESTSSTPASKPPDVTEAENAAAAAKDSAANTATNMKDMAHDKTAAAAGTLSASGDSIVSGAANATASSGAAATAPANSAVSADTSEAQKLLDQAMQYIKDNKLDDANNVLTKLEALKPKLPAEWASKIDSARSAYNTAKSGSDKLKSLVPGGAQ